MGLAFRDSDRRGAVVENGTLFLAILATGGETSVLGQLLDVQRPGFALTGAGFGSARSVVQWRGGHRCCADVLVNLRLLGNSSASSPFPKASLGVFLCSHLCIVGRTSKETFLSEEEFSF